MRPRNCLFALTFCLLGLAAARGDTLDEIRTRGELVWGADAEGGGPYVYPDPADPRRRVGFEVELAALLAESLEVKSQFFQGPWQNLPALLGTGQIDMVLNGYELTPVRAAQMDHTRPYYIYQLVLMARREHTWLKAWSDLDQRPAGDKRPKIGVLEGSAAHYYLRDHLANRVDIVVYEGTTDAMREVETSKLDATLVDTPAAIFYRDRFAGLVQIGEPVARGYYVAFVRTGDDRLRAALNAALEKLLADGKLQAIYERYGLWNDLQSELASLGSSDEALGVRATELRGWQVIRSRGWLLVQSAGITVLLALLAMPLAIAIGLGVALVRLYGPAPLRWLSIIYVEILRGTPLLLQLYVIYYVLPELRMVIPLIPNVPAIAAGVLGLAINYSAYEAEIYRAGLQAVPRGQMEAALALGMSPALALRRIIVPQAVRIVVPPVTNDFIAMFKDTSVCSVITVMELTKQYSVQRNDTGATLELAALTALLYLLMSVPLARVASIVEKRMARRARST